jgi:hypothetical protein
MTISEGALRDAATRLTRDLVATLGWDWERAALFVEVEAAIQMELEGEDDSIAQDLAERVQQAIQDQFIDTTWPACSRHQRHPLEVDDSNPPWWRCPIDTVRQARLGELQMPSQGQLRFLNGP